MPQFFIDKEIKAGSEVDIRGADARHISQVLRLKANDWVVLSDGEGRSFRAIITQSLPRAVRARIEVEIKRRESPPPPALAIAIIKGDRFEWAIQKAVEIGCRYILPFRSARTVPQYADNVGERKLERWRKIALEAAKQSGLPFRPQVDGPREFQELIGESKEFGRTILFYEGERQMDLRSLFKANPPSPSPSLLIIGPEGGFTDDEVALARQAGAITASLGPQILRVETAAAAALAIWQYELGNMNVD